MKGRVLMGGGVLVLGMIIFVGIVGNGGGDGGFVVVGG